MKKLFLIAILFVMSVLGSTTKSFAQTDREILLELSKQQIELSKQVAELSKQVTEVVKQQAVTNMKVEGADKRMDILFGIIIASSSILFAGIFGLIGVIFWDRKTTAQPFEAKTDKLQAEVNLMKEKELKLEKRLLKNENNFKRIAEIDPRFANIS